MTFCLDCRRVWPREALICGTCRRSFGGRLCDNKHISFATATNCTICGSRKLLQPARYMRLQFPIMLLASIVMLFLIKLLLSKLALLIQLSFDAVSLIFQFLTGHELYAVLSGFTILIGALYMMWIGVRRIIGPESSPVRLVEYLVPALLRQSADLLRLACRGIVRATKGVKEPGDSSSRGNRE